MARAAIAGMKVSIPTTVSGGLQLSAISSRQTSTISFQYRQRYQEGYNSHTVWSPNVFPCRFQYRQRYQEGYNKLAGEWANLAFGVSIPTTVSGGLQLSNNTATRFFQAQGFNTDNGIRRATMLSTWVSITRKSMAFQYRQRYQEGYNRSRLRKKRQLQRRFQYRQRYQEGYNILMSR